MSKPSYAAVVASPTKDTHRQGGEPSQSSGPSQGDAPPPYTGPSSHGPPAAIQPHGHAANNLESQPIYHVGENQGWVPPANQSIARSRAQRRFWVAFFWAWFIWIIIGLIIGGGVSDIERNPNGRHGHWSKHGKWHQDQVGRIDGAATAPQ